MSDTPETDMLLSEQHHDCVPFDAAAAQLAELCRKLEHKNSTLKSHWITACQERDGARRERDEARKQIIVGWYGDEVPSYTQGPPTHELEELMTADQANHLVAKLVEARGALDKATAELEMWRECAEGLAFIVKNSAADYSILRDREAALAEFERLKEGGK